MTSRNDAHNIWGLGRLNYSDYIWRNDMPFELGGRADKQGKQKKGAWKCLKR